MRRLLILALSSISFGLAAQNVSIRKVELAGEKIVVYYDLDDSNSSNEYQLSLYASKDNYAAPLTKVKGDIGSEVKPGIGKKVEWSVLEEYGAYKGRMALELRGKVFVAFAKLTNFDTEKSYKRGKQYNILWKPGNTNPLSIELLKGNQRIQGEMNHPNNGDYLLSIPSNATPGKDYRLKITDSKSSDFIYTGFFRVAPKIPMGVKAAAVLVLIGGGVAAASGGGGGSSDTHTNTFTIPDPPLPN